MKPHTKHIIPALFFIVLGSLAGPASADPCLVVYPAGPCIYLFDPSEYYAVGPDHPLYDPLYDRDGWVLLERGTDEIDHSIYQAPNIQRFKTSWDGNEGYVFNATSFTLIVDGFSNKQVTYENILLVFGHPNGGDECMPFIEVNGMPITGNVYPLGDLAVTTPTAEGKNYSDIMTVDIDWHGCYGLHVWAYADENYNGIKDGGECFTAFSHDVTIQTEDASWGAIKSIYK